MKIVVFSLAATSLALAGCAHSGSPQREPPRDEARLAELIEGRIAGEPRSCIAAFDQGRLRILNRTAVVYDAGDTIWVARPSDPGSLDTRDIVVIERTGGQLCKQDFIRTIDRTGQFMTGVIFLGDFVPYRER